MVNEEYDMHPVLISWTKTGSSVVQLSMEEELRLPLLI